MKDALRHALRITRKRVHHLDSCDVKRLKHKVVRFITCKEADGKKLWVVVDSLPYSDNVCHACRTELSFFVYKKSGKYWKLQAKNIKLLYFASFGIPPSKGDIRLIKVGWKHYGLAVYNRYEHQRNLLVLTIITNIKRKIRNVFSTPIYYDDSFFGSKNIKHSKWKTKLHFIKGKKYFYDIEVHRYGISEEKRVNYKATYRYKRGYYRTMNLDPLDNKDL